MSNYPRKKHRYKKGKKSKIPTFDRSLLSEEDKAVLHQFSLRRKLFDGFIKQKNLPVFTCPSCAYPTLQERGQYEWCILCEWEDDGSDDPHILSITAPNYLSLIEARVNMGTFFRDFPRNAGLDIDNDPKKVVSSIQLYLEKLKTDPSSHIKDLTALVKALLPIGS